MKKSTKIELAGAALAAGALGAYYFFGSDSGKKHRLQAAAWMKKAEKDIVVQASKLKDAAFNEENYNKIVAAVSEKYQTMKNLDAEDVAKFVAVVGSAWKDIKDMKKNGVTKAKIANSVKKVQKITGNAGAPAPKRKKAAAK